MPDRNLYEYAVIRYVPKVEREEFINVGLLMMCKKAGWIKVMTLLSGEKLKAVNATHTQQELQMQLRSFAITAEGGRSAGEMGELPVEERFRWLTAVKSSCLQTSRPHPGITDDLEEEFNRLFHDLVQ